MLFGRANFQNELYFMDTAKQFTSGIWERPQISYKEISEGDAFYYMMEGEIVIQNERGDFVFIYPGQGYIVPAGFSGQWDIVKFTRQLYACHQIGMNKGL